eukprot:CAMPEP_0181124350 /NCGR_PEP_ID=MMETSP1071-20121207/26430_1 /TAXON_ID=35127 /ORGANISM="Thalassiosira sp., Strain NH16" /LENGTH=69 /DNA_ID=CAMNT_0023209641 /DNA_START=1 /DNA_END=207 /DNA_ORIENTATION=+
MEEAENSIKHNIGMQPPTKRRAKKPAVQSVRTEGSSEARPKVATANENAKKDAMEERSAGGAGTNPAKK